MKTISSKLQSIDSTRFLANSLSNLVKNLAEGFHEIKRKHGDDKNVKLIKGFNEESDERYFLEGDVQHSEKLLEFDNDLPFLPERIKIQKFRKLLANLHDKN